MQTLIDILLVVAFALTALAGFRNGFFRELFSLLGMVGGVIAGMRLTGVVLDQIDVPFLHTELGTSLVFLLLFLLVFAAATILGGLLAMVWEGKSPTGSSRLAGLGLGALRGFLLVTVLAGALTLLSPFGSETLGQSRVMPFLSGGVQLGAGLLPDDLADRLLEYWNALPFDEATRHGRQIQV
ncbi:MAG: CvpA family protein [Candidatus Eisenbacteria bacterium]|uniref:CvpA family protein n=1 Tax=Eiseniibacteriota bacterium TaxID=2212470 RepID=A0A956M2Z8_UNCEI|nr:CvpA family protein [Candidatus Eisenbacteria bacterium]